MLLNDHVIKSASTRRSGQVGMTKKVDLGIVLN